jgi:DNA polymerase elongation subunit (family B)
MGYELVENFEVECLGEIEQDVYDIEVEDNHNFFGNDILVHNSNYVSVDEIVVNMGLDFKTNQEFFDWSQIIEKKVFEPFFDKVLTINANKYGVEQIIEFKREKIITQKFILAKKKYADQVIANEKKLFIDKPKISITGIEVVRTDTPSFCRERIMSVIDQIFRVQGSDKEPVLDKLRKIHEDFLKADPSDIAVPTGIKDYQKYAQPVEVYLANNTVKYPAHCPKHVRAAMNYNYIVAKHNLPLMPVNNGTKMKYMHVAPHKNELHQDVIGFINEWPQEFNSMFFVDIEEQWIKVFQRAIQRFFDVLGWGNIQLEKNILENFMEF